MSLGDIHRHLADLIDDIEASDVRVTEVVSEGTGDGETVTAELTVELPLQKADAEAATPTPTRSAADRGATAEMTATTAEPIPIDEGHESVEESAEPDDSPAESEDGAEADDESRPTCKHPECDATFDTEHGMKIHYTKVHVGSDAAVPAYRDPERLREAYEAHDTLTEVRDALDADVTVTTIRRHLLEHGLYDPDADDQLTEEADERATDPDETETDEPDGSDAERSERREGESSVSDEPAGDDSVPFDETTEVAPGVTAESFREALHGAATVSGVQRRLGLDRDATLELLREYDVLELVGGRVASKPDRDAQCAAVDERLRAHRAP